jgi:hypothetical protein
MGTVLLLVLSTLGSLVRRRNTGPAARSSPALGDPA